MQRLPPPMDEDLRRFIRWVGGVSPDGAVLEARGVTASIVPEAPERSVVNSVVYRSAGELKQALPHLERAYAEAGVHAWTVWVPGGDRDGARLLADAGHELDGSPAAMIADLAGLRAPDRGDLDWSSGAGAIEVAAVNDAAYGYADRPFGRALGTMSGVHAYVARVDGVASSVLATEEGDGSAGVYLVATLPEARGRGLASRLLGCALAEARERGCSTATLQASRAGAPVYERLGFRVVGQLEMWERRTAPGSAQGAPTSAS